MVSKWTFIHIFSNTDWKNKKNNFLNANGVSATSNDNYDKMYFDMMEDVPQNSYDDEYQQLEIHSGSMTL